ncbi:hypothetical protein AAFF_G00075190 [Aldrovandia affinis]|uniref:Bcl-x interacting BH3 domain-containing protein n=1 Tax=Aldrovandia affinis TaxID=143900 RepID=A0AAD7RXV0_9TELE|nr:hypothetical protein AAFF_G00075190 [Aldrovandia affinis]
MSDPRGQSHANGGILPSPPESRMHRDGDPLPRGITSPPPPNRRLTRPRSGPRRRPPVPVFAHAQPRLDHEHEHEHENHQRHEMPQGPELWVGQELRRIGDEVNRFYTHRGAGRNRNDGGAYWAILGRDWSERSLWLWVAFLVGRLLQILLRRR